MTKPLQTLQLVSLVWLILSARPGAGYGWRENPTSLTAVAPRLAKVTSLTGSLNNYLPWRKQPDRQQLIFSGLILLTLLGLGIWLERQRWQQALQRRCARDLERQVAEQTLALRVSETRLKEAQRLAKLSIWQVDATTRQLTWAEEIFDLLGFELDQRPLGHQTMERLLPPADRQRLEAAIDQTLATGQPFEVEHWMERGDGTWANMLSRGEEMFNATGMVTGLWGITLDISEQKRAELALREQEQLLRKILDGLPVQVFLKDYNGDQMSFRYLNRSVLEAFGVADHPMESITYFSLFGDDSYRFQQDDQDVIRRGIPEIKEDTFEFQGHTIYFLISRTPIQLSETAPMLLACAVDISDRKRTELALQESEALQRAVLSVLPDLIMLISADGTFLEQITYRPDLDLIPATEQRIGYTIHDKLPPDIAALASQAIQQAIATQTIQHYEQQVDFNGQIRYETVYCVPMDQQRVVFVVRDMTERKRIELHLQELNTQLRQLSSTDSLTQVANRRHMQATLQREWQRCQRDHCPLALILLDVDHFKPYNDYYGHLQGDVALQQLAQILQESINRPGDLAARYGGEEFLLVLPSTHVEGATVIAQRIQSRLATLAIPHQVSPTSPLLSVSMGIVVVANFANLTPENAIAQADTALYLAKQTRNAFEVQVI